ncbi:hypothetical protein [Paracoccus hibiscisoli]|nr:hypothetical protein [Paracoccus hibiscisoli]
MKRRWSIWTLHPDAETVENIALVGAPLVDLIVSDWELWKDGV